MASELTMHKVFECAFESLAACQLDVASFLHWADLDPATCCIDQGFGDEMQQFEHQLV